MALTRRELWNRRSKETREMSCCPINNLVSEAQARQ
jgi:hypothetical protein